LERPRRSPVVLSNQQRVNGTGMKHRQFIRKAIRLSSRMAFSLLERAQEAGAAARRRIDNWIKQQKTKNGAR
jgi:hypothetical protein